MDETRVRGLLELAAAATEEPPSRVDVELARSRARRKLRWRRASLAGASAAAVVAVVVAAVAVPGSHGAAPGRGRAPEAHAQIIAPRQFSLVSPYAAFGWLPPGDSLDGGTLSPSNVYLTAGPGPSWALTVYTAGFCNLTSAQVLRQLGQSQRPRLNCANSAGGTVYPVTSVAAAQVDGHTAFWTMKHVYLIWQYADNGWAALAPPKSAGTRTAIKVASEVSYGAAGFPGRVPGAACQHAGRVDARLRPLCSGLGGAARQRVPVDRDRPRSGLAHVDHGPRHAGQLLLLLPRRAVHSADDQRLPGDRQTTCRLRTGMLRCSRSARRTRMGSWCSCPRTADTRRRTPSASSGATCGSSGRTRQAGPVSRSAEPGQERYPADRLCHSSASSP